MKLKTTPRVVSIFVALALLLSLVSASAAAAPSSAPSVPVNFSILHTNDFHGQLEASGSNPGMARVAAYVNSVRTALGDSNVLVVDAGDEMQGSLLSNLQQGAPTIATYNAMSYDAATFGNHEFDWGQTVLANRTSEAAYPYVTANIVQNDTGNCATAGWTPPVFADAPYQILEAGVAPNTVKVAFIGVTTAETPTITLSTATAGLCFKDPASSILHYYDEMKSAGADVIVVLSHLGYLDGGYGYGISVYGDQSLAAKLNTAGKPVHLIIGGHSHTDLSAATVVGTTKVVQAHYNGRKVGRADITVGIDGSVVVNWVRQIIATTDPQDPAINAVVTAYATDPAYVALINTPVGYTQVDLLRNYNGDSMMGDFVDDAIYNYLNTDAEPVNDVDMFFNNAGGIRIDWCEKEDPLNPGTYIWSSTAADCNTGTWTHDPMLLNYGQMFQILPFGNQTIVGNMTGAQILELLHQSATLFKGAIQPSGIRYSFFRYSDANPGPQPYGWGAYDVEVYNKTTLAWEPLNLTKTYKVGTNEFLAPAGQDGFAPFKYMKNISYWGDMLNAVNAYVSATYTFANPYKGPDGDGTLDARITRNGDGDDVYEASEIVPLTVLHHNDSHGNLAKGTYVGYTQLATLIKQERLHNPNRTLLLSSGDNIQGDAMSYYFKTAPTGFTSDGTVIADPALHIQPLIKAFNSMNYDAMTLGNHEFNFGKDIFTSVLSQATFPLLQANVADDGSYGLAAANIQPYVEKTVGGDINVAILGIGNHRIPNYELPSNIPGLTFSDPILKTQELSALLRPTNDVVIALTHIGFTENPASVEVDANVDTNLVVQTSGLDAVIGGHSHTNPATGFGAYKYLPSIIADADGSPVVTAHAYRYNNTLGEVVMGLRDLGSGNYETVSQTGRYISVALTDTEDTAVKAIVDPYATLLTTYNNTVIGATTAPIDTMQAFTQETNGANLQADASVYELSVKNSIPVDFHLSGAMTNKLIATTATPALPYSLKISDMFSAMPYENSLVVLNMNGPQLKAVLERAYRNYYYYKYVTGYGGYSYYTTCMLDTNFGNQITYNDLYPAAYDPAKEYVVSLVANGIEVDFNDASTYYRVSTVNYLAAGSCNFNNGGVSLWPLNQIVADTQFYVRDAVIDYVTHMGTVSPAVEGRLSFITDVTPPSITITAPTASTYLHPASLTLDFSAADDIAGVKQIEGLLDGEAVITGQTIDLYTLALGDHTLTVNAVDKAGNASTQSVTFSITATIDSLKTAVTNFYQDGSISNKGTYKSLMEKLNAASKSTKPEVTSALLNAFILEVKSQSGRRITSQAADLLIADAKWVIIHLPDSTSPLIKIMSPRATSYYSSQTLKIEFAAFDMITGVKEVSATLDGAPVVNGQRINLSTLTIGTHTFTLTAVDYAGNIATKTVTFKVINRHHHH
ncbi:MAG: 5'-nucleotidase C-terminal domain-containing protein [Chloroflexi bacterium]|nr:5'-nucleotidase C-terminal domain-containing protein [Chloroflexota bacterium]